MLTSLLLCGCSGYGGVLIPEREGRGRDKNIVRKMGKGRGGGRRRFFTGLCVLYMYYGRRGTCSCLSGIAACGKVYFIISLLL